MILPIAFEERMKDLLKDDYELYKDSFNEKHYTGLRINTLKISPNEFLKISPFTLERIPFIENGFYYDIAEQPARHPYYHAGLYYIQEPSAMIPANLLAINPGDKVLDLCAAPGGKSTELAAKLQGRGVLISNDISNTRAKALLKNIELFGVKNAIVVSESPSKLENYFPEYFDKILVDAPCSGEGMFRKSPAMIKDWEERGVEYYEKLQKEIIISAAKMLKPGGFLVYSTCTFSPEENEGTIKYLLEEFPEFSVVNPLTKTTVSYDGFDFGKPEWVDGPDELRNAIRIWPHKIKGEGHFICLLQKGNEIKEGKGITNQNHNLSPKTMPKEAKDFISELDFPIDYDQIELIDDKLYVLPYQLPSLKGLRILRSGLLLGEIKKNRFEPNQALAMALRQEEYKYRINLSSSDSEVIKYLKCETIQIEGDYKDGLQLICVDGYPLGFGKLSNTTLKNKYLASWRWM